jgi:hypothetical protein
MIGYLQDADTDMPKDRLGHTTELRKFSTKNHHGPSHLQCYVQVGLMGCPSSHARWFERR